MNNYEAIKNMNKKELTGFLYTFLLPWVGGEKDESIKSKLWQQLENFLNSEVKNK